MLRFFRHIRQRLFLEGKVSRYLGYAVGEIVLIVVGILIALQISNWNEESKNAEEEHQLLALVNESLESYIFLLEMGLKRQEEVVAASERLMQAMKNPSMPIDTEKLGRDLVTIGSSRFFVGAGTTTNIYDVLIDGGKLGLISSENLQKALRTLKQQFSFALIYEQIRASFIDDQISPFLNQHIDRLGLAEGVLVNDSNSLDRPFATDYETLLKSREFSNLLAELIKHTEATIACYRRPYRIVSQIDALVVEANPSLEPNTFDRIDFLVQPSTN